jgi:serine/threonine-protein kinase
MRDGAGTPIYMAPERLLMFAADEIKCDIYSMGVTLFEAMLLKKPFQVPADVTAPALAPHLAAAEPRRARQFDPDFPHELEAIIMKAMARDPARRFESARELASSLEHFVATNPPRRLSSPHMRPTAPQGRGLHVLGRHGWACLAGSLEANRRWPWCHDGAQPASQG